MYKYKKNQLISVLLSLICFVCINCFEDIDNNPSYTFDPLESDTTPPAITSTFPEDEDESVPINEEIMVTFSEPIDIYTVEYINNFTVKGDGHYYSGDFSYNDDNTTITFTPSKNLNPYTTYWVTISTEVADPAGNKMEEEYNWSFTTAIVVDSD
ncbi:MAG: Ig-like domain-containing protein [Spirochaetota bacterium]|nr:Ig-like domain-containing protein [Spirochaetota bacterium]